MLTFINCVSFILLPYINLFLVIFKKAPITEAEMLFKKHDLCINNKTVFCQWCFITKKKRDKDLTLLNHLVNFIPWLRLLSKG